jgi:membrane protease YdiL (CAAX protease family)
MIHGRVAGGATIRRPPAAAWLRPTLLLGGLAAVVWLRWLVTRSSGLDGVMVGVGFGLVLLGVTALGLAGPAVERRAALPRPTLGAVAVGLAGGAALIAIALAARVVAVGPPLAVAATFGPWVAATLLVAGAEELLLRGVLFRAIERSGGLIAAVALTSLAFALMHVPTYGWHVVPLDLGVGIFLGGLRLAGGGWTAPTVAHAVADLATWWL